MTERPGPRRSTVLALLPVAAAVAAVAVVAVLLVRNPTLGTSQTKTAPVTTSTSAPTPTPTNVTTSPTTTARPTSTLVFTTSPEPVKRTYPVPQQTVVVDPSKLSTGAAPGIAYFSGPAESGQTTTGYIHPANGGQAFPVQLPPGEKVSAFARLGAGYLVVASASASESEIRYYKSPDEMTQLSPLQYSYKAGPVRGDDGTVAISLRPGHVTLFAPTGAREQKWNLPEGTLVRLMRVLPGDRVLAVLSTIHGSEKLELEPNGDIVSVHGRSFWAVDENPVTGNLSMYATCQRGAQASRVVDRNTQQTLWIDCGYVAGPFNPAGTVTAAVANKWTYRDNNVVAILDATSGEMPLLFRASTWTWNGEHVQGVRWEDDTHLLVDVCSGKCRLLRFGTDGSAEKADSSVPNHGYLVLEQ